MPQIYRPEVITTLQQFRDLKPWRGTVGQRLDKIRFLHDRLCAIYEKQVNLIVSIPASGEDQVGNGGFSILKNTIVLMGKVSVVTYLNCFARAIGRNEQGAHDWSVELYRQIFPRSAARMIEQGGVILKPSQN